jgi:Uma2 family endonuclease
MTALSAPLPVHRWTYDEWDEMVAAGFFEGKRVELIDGEVIDMSPQMEVHVAGVTRAAAAMRRTFDECRYWVRVQAPLRAGHDSDPEPDVAVIRGTEEQYLKSGHPTKALIVIEVSHDSLNRDRKIKADLCASAGIGDYWIINLRQRQVEVHRKPVRDSKRKFGWRYSEVAVLRAEDSIAPLAAKGTLIAIRDLLPKSAS